MATDLLLPAGIAPSNLHLREGVRHRMVESDVYMICERVREVDPSLYILELQEGDKFRWAIMEDCRDGVHRLVFRVKALDARIIEKLRYLMARPLHERLAEIEAMEYKWEEERKEKEMDELYEKLGRPMWTELERCGFIQRGISYPKLGVAAPGRSR